MSHVETVYDPQSGHNLCCGNHLVHLMKLSVAYVRNGIKYPAPAGLPAVLHRSDRTAREMGQHCTALRERAAEITDCSSVLLFQQP
jgi:hypothetical protein